MNTSAADLNYAAAAASAVAPILTEIKATTLTTTTTTTKALLSSVSSSGLVTVVRNSERQPSLVLNKSASSFSFNNSNNNNNTNCNNKQKNQKICRQKSVYLEENPNQLHDTAEDLKERNLQPKDSRGSFLSFKTDSLVTIIPNNSIHKQSSISSVSCVVNSNLNQINCANEDNSGSLERDEKTSIESPTNFLINNNSNTSNNERNIPLSVSSTFNCSSANNDFTEYKINETRNTKRLFVNEPSSLKSSFNSVR
jgi:hypothetical protein